MKNILIVDDDLEISGLLKTILNIRFLVDRIDICPSPETAIEQYDKYKYDIVITDLNLKNSITGDKLYYILKEKYPSIIICLTGTHRSKYPFDEIIFKPSSISNIITVMSKYVEKKT